jgi:hypothetical protein
MANFSQNQVRQFYIAKAKGTTFTDSTAAGTVLFNAGGDDVWLTYQTPNGDNGGNATVRSDLIPKKNINSVVLSKPASRKLKRLEVAFDSTVNSGAPVPGQEYVLRFTFYNLGLGGHENQYIKESGSVKAVTGDTAATVLTKLYTIAQKNLGFEYEKYVSITDGTGKLTIEEISQPWVLGKRQADPIDFQIHCVPVLVSGTSTVWGTVTNTTSTNTNVVENGRVVADMEYFYIGERADQFRGVGYPDNFDTKYLADASKKYYLLDISYFYQGSGEDVQKSQKYITVAFPSDATYTLATLKTDLDTLFTSTGWTDKSS